MLSGTQRRKSQSKSVCWVPRQGQRGGLEREGLLTCDAYCQRTQASLEGGKGSGPASPPGRSDAQAAARTPGRPAVDAHAKPPCHTTSPGPKRVTKRVNWCRSLSTMLLKANPGNGQLPLESIHLTGVSPLTITGMRKSTSGVT
mmetsp:Transcript_36205/g.100516  ORF Transcript_36205/g.100516 Transcript_36205/m.100516 type:complete len:144 (-) Transcript_36205:231-662(-)